ncbi:MAG: hypothetical protein JW779_08480 [Candidatus Thorarchaeota archaeon]|nr:hypothetical protein [Candidatus Thorarchaeota archaeon]
MCPDNEYADIHETLLPYSDVLTFLEKLEENGDVKSYCNGSNCAGRWFFQIYSKEFIDELVSVINHVLRKEKEGTILEVMSGDGRFTEFLQTQVHTRVIATDAKDGRYSIAYPKWIETLDALEAIRKYNPSFIVLSWEPYLSMTGIEIAVSGIPLAWIGNPEMCGHQDIFQRSHRQLNSRFALSRHDSFKEKNFKTDVFLFNC